jgi:hypothetical protein
MQPKPPCLNDGPTSTNKKHQKYPGSRQQKKDKQKSTSSKPILTTTPSKNLNN